MLVWLGSAAWLGNRKPSISWQILVAWIPLGFILFSRLFSEKHSIGESCLRGQIQYFSAGCFLPHLECWSCPYKKRTERLCLQRFVNDRFLTFKKRRLKRSSMCRVWFGRTRMCDPNFAQRSTWRASDTAPMCKEPWLKLRLERNPFSAWPFCQEQAIRSAGTATFSSSFAVPWIEPPNLWTQIVWVWKPSWRKVAATFGLWRLG